MPLFRRALRLSLLVAGVLLGFTTALAAYFTRMVLRPPRQRLWATPADLGLPFEEVHFPARDGVRLSGWFVPGPAAGGRTIVMVHGWPWNRLGSAAEGPFSDLPGSSPVQLLPLALSLHRLGYQLLMFDLRNHGQSAAGGAVTFGLREAADLLGALDYLRTRPDAGRAPVGVVGFSSGANALLYALPRTGQIGAAVAIQPTSPTIFARRYARTLLGPLGRPVLAIAEVLIRLLGGVRLGAIEPAFAAAGSDGTPVFYLQGTGDRWGSAADVALMVERTPAAEALYVETRGRHGGYQYAIDHPELLDAFFRQHLA